VPDWQGSLQVAGSLFSIISLVKSQWNSQFLKTLERFQGLEYNNRCVMKIRRLRLNPSAEGTGQTEDHFPWERSSNPNESLQTEI
jgi:hypothetical protein